MSTKIDLSNTSLIAIGSTKIDETLKAIDICKTYCNFKEIIYFSDQSNPYQYKINSMTSIKDYDKFVVFDLPNINFDTDFILTIHWDGFIVNPNAWTNNFFQYDYIGAPWPHIHNIVGNGGFCLKSKKFLEAQKYLIKHLNIKSLNDPDDFFLCYRLRKYFLDLNCKYGDDIGYCFSTEHGGYHYHNSFGFHDFRPNPSFKTLIGY
jgi:hypothetical protein